MAAIKKIKLEWIKSLMIFSQAVLLLFATLWLIGQYNDQREELKKNLVKLFTDVQQKVTDSLYINHVMASVAPPNITLSPQGLHGVLAGAHDFSQSKDKGLFGTDTIIFNELFANQMKQNGWNFNAEWINSSDSNNKGSKAIFIQSNFFTNQNGVVVRNFSWYLYLKLLPQFAFVLILLSLTTAAFGITFKSMRTQAKLTNLKDDFISNMSHELKTPIATVKIALEALNNFNVIENREKSREYLGMATSEMDRLELLATRVLNTSLLESGKMDLQRESYDLKKIVEEVLQTMQLRVQQQGAKIVFESSGSNFRVPIDRLHIQGVLVNLVDNSLKYGVAPVSIKIRLSQNDGAVQLALTDNGPGIPEEYREKVFEKFFRIPTGNRHNTKGYGLGLSYAAQVMRQHNGSISVNNVAGGGCVFTLTF